MNVAVWPCYTHSDFLAANHSLSPGSRVNKMKRIITPLFVFAFLLITPSVLNAKETWTSVRSQNFTVIGNSSENDLRNIAIRLEQFRRAYSIIFASGKVDSAAPTVVMVFNTDDAFKPFKLLFKGKRQDSLVGYFMRRPEVNYIALTTGVRGADPFEVIFHEYGHFIIENNIRNAPVWLSEGLAEFYGTFDSSDNEQKIKLGAPILRHIATLRNENYIPLEKLINVDYKSPYYHEANKAGIFYAESWALVHYLMLGDHQKREKQFFNFVGHLNPNESPENAIARVFQTDLKTLDKELRQYINGFTMPSVEYSLTKRLDYDHGLKVKTLTEAESEYYLGDLLLKQGRVEEAETRLQKSVALDPKLAAPKGSLGALRASQELRQEALSLLKASVELDPDNYLLNHYYGNVLYQNRQYDLAIEQYKLAAALKPDFALNYVNLGFAYAQTGNINEAEESFKLAIKYDPMFPLYRSTSTNYFIQGHWQQAAEHGMAFLRQSGWRDDHAPYAALIAYFGFQQTKHAEEADYILNKAITILDKNAWPYPVVQYLQHSISEKELFALAKDGDKLTEAHAYLGLSLLLGGDRENALTHFRWVVSSGNKAFIEYSFALAEIARISRGVEH